jgi:Tfp pilus assembly protein PilO
MTKLSLKPSKTTIIILAGLLVAAVVVIVSVLAWANSGISGARNVLAQKVKEKDEGVHLASRLTTVQTDLTLERSELRFLESSVSDAAYVPTLLKQIENLAVSTRNEVKQIRPQVAAAPKPVKAEEDPESVAKRGRNRDGQAKPAADPYNRLQVLITVSGKFGDVQRFVDSLTRFPKVIAVRNIGMRPRGGEQDAIPTLDVDLQLTAFILKDAPAARPVVTASGENNAKTAL